MMHSEFAKVEVHDSFAADAIQLSELVLGLLECRQGADGCGAWGSDLPLKRAAASLAAPAASKYMCAGPPCHFPILKS